MADLKPGWKMIKCEDPTGEKAGSCNEETPHFKGGTFPTNSIARRVLFEKNLEISCTVTRWRCSRCGAYTLLPEEKET